VLEIAALKQGSAKLANGYPPTYMPVLSLMLITSAVFNETSVTHTLIIQRKFSSFAT
jgi:hypothetical protein